MLELGHDAERAHTEVGRLVAAQGYDQLAVTGSYASHVVSGACSGGMSEEKALAFSSTLEIADWTYNQMLQGRVTKGDWLLVKGSRGMRMEEVLQELKRRFATGIEEKGEK